MTDGLSSEGFDLHFPQVYEPQLASGVLRSIADDFQVEEQLGYEPEGTGEHCFIWLRKREANTEWVAEQLAQFSGIRKRDVNYAGRKDRHAVTIQWFSLWLPGQPDPDFSQLDLPGVEVLKVYRHNRKLRRGSHQGNQFVIKIREIAGLGSLTGAALTSAIDDRLAAIREQGFPNYFGPQRFGHDGQNLHQAQQLITALLESGASSRRRGRRGDIYVSAARSYLFNRVLAAHVEAGSWQQLDERGRPETGPLPGLVRKPHPAAAWEQKVLEAATGQLAEHWVSCFAQIGMKASRRPLAVLPSDLSWRWQDQVLQVSFGLPTGSYATALLEQIFVLQ